MTNEIIWLRTWSMNECRMKKTIPETNMEPENEWLENEVSVWDGLFSWMKVSLLKNPRSLRSSHASLLRYGKQCNNVKGKANFSCHRRFLGILVPEIGEPVDTLIEKYMAQPQCIGSYGPFTNLPFGSQCTDVAGQISWGISMYRCTNGLQQLLEYTLMKTCRCHRLSRNDMVVWTIKSYDRSISLRDVFPSNQKYQHNAVDVRCISSWKTNETVQDYLPCPKTNQVAPQKLMVGSWNVLLGILANFQGRSLLLSRRLLPSLPKKSKSSTANIFRISPASEKFTFGQGN